MIIISIIFLSTNISWKYYLGVPILSLLSSYSLTLIFIFGKTPVILLLGISSKDSIKVQSVLLKTFRREIGYARSIVSLLDLESYINDLSIGVYNRGGTSRTSSDTWYQTVQELCQIVKIIVINYSETSTLLKEELQWIIGNKLNNKVIIFKTGEKPFPENFDVKSLKIVNNWQGLVRAINNRL
ncbi:hypothetical protein GCM10011368_11000 [Hyunsoonleella pacifica]|nr:hypothetical protein GCM10011368_11000 [Hyunsoonleella pacifica]